MHTFNTIYTYNTLKKWWRVFEHMRANKLNNLLMKPKIIVFKNVSTKTENKM